MLGWLPPYPQPSYIRRFGAVLVGDRRPSRGAMPHVHPTFLPRLLRPSSRAVVAAAVSAALLGTGLTAPSSGDLQSQIAGTRSAAATLRAQIAADSQQIASTSDGVARAQARLSSIQDRLNARAAELTSVQGHLVAARDHLVDLENRMHAATAALSANLVAGYESSQPNIVSVILSSKGFGDLLNQMGFMARVAHQDASILKFTRTARAEVARQATALESLEVRDRTLASQVLTQRNQAAALRTALLHQQIAQETRRANTAARYNAVKGHLGALQARLDQMEKRAAEAATRAAATGNANVSGIAVNTAGMVQPPAGAPEAVRQVIAAGNAIATLPYIYGGGHASFHADGYDCSGSVSYALAAAALVSSPMVSGAYESWGEPGPGQLDHDLRQCRPRVDGGCRLAL